PVAPRGFSGLRLRGRQQHVGPGRVAAAPAAVETGQILVLPAQKPAPGGITGNRHAERRRQVRLELAPVAIARVVRIAPGGLRRLLERGEGERKPLEGVVVSAVYARHVAVPA